jgi:hypothetical protein
MAKRRAKTVSALSAEGLFGIRFNWIIILLVACDYAKEPVINVVVRLCQPTG